MQLLLKINDILFSAGSERNLRIDHRHLLQFHGAKKTYVIPFGMAQIKQVLNGENFLRVLNEQLIKAVSCSSNMCI